MTTETKTAKKQQVHHPVNAQWICAVTKVAVFDFFYFFRNKFGNIIELNWVFSVRYSRQI